jgi:ankyrin repeat protein
MNYMKNTKNGKTALHIAVEEGQIAVVRELLAKDASCTILDNVGY